MKYRLEVTYATGGVQVHDDLTAAQTDTAVYAFTHDMLMLGGRGVTRLLVEVKP
jgi:hypothetical protein